MRVAVLGTGTMGRAMALNMARAGLEVAAWNRTREKAQPLAKHGVAVADTAPDAVRGAEVVVTMLSDGEATAAAMHGPAGAAAAMDESAVWAQMGTVGLSGIENAAAIAEERGVTLVDAPVLGTKEPAEKGELIVLASGAPDAIERCRPVFDAVGRQTIELGEAGSGTRLKLVLNGWLVALVEGLAEAIALAEALNLDPKLFLDTIAGGPIDSPYAQLKGGMMVERNFDPSFALSMARKDVELVIEAAERHALALKLPPAIAEAFDRAIERGHGDEYTAAVYLAVLGLAE